MQISFDYSLNRRAWAEKEWAQILQNNYSNISWDLNIIRQNCKGTGKSSRVNTANTGIS